MSGAHLHFERAELDGRIARTLAALQARELDGLLMFRQESSYWLTGCDTFGYVYFQHYHACLMRTLLSGEPDPHLIAMNGASRDALLAMEDALRPGRPERLSTPLRELWTPPSRGRRGRTPAVTRLGRLIRRTGCTGRCCSMGTRWRRRWGWYSSGT